jgi:hypothetical protein
VVTLDDEAETRAVVASTLVELGGRIGQRVDPATVAIEGATTHAVPGERVDRLAQNPGILEVGVVDRHLVGKLGTLGRPLLEVLGRDQELDRGPRRVTARCRSGRAPGFR